MHPYRTLLLVLVLTTFSRAADKELPRVLIIGDSISIGYTKDVQQLLNGKAAVTRIRGNGGNTGRGLQNIDKWLGDKHYDVIHFNWGLWDLCYRHPESKTQGKRDKKRGIITATPEQYSQNLTKLVARLKQTKATLIWANTTPVPPLEAGRHEGDGKKYNAIAEKVMKANGIVVNDLHVAILPHMSKYQVGPGNVHFKPEGSKLLAEQVAKAISNALKK